MYAKPMKIGDLISFPIRGNSNKVLYRLYGYVKFDVCNYTNIFANYRAGVYLINWFNYIKDLPEVVIENHNKCFLSQSVSDSVKKKLFNLIRKNNFNLNKKQSFVLGKDIEAI